MCLKLFAALAVCVATALPAQPPPPAPKLVVVLVVDQLSSELYNRYRDRFTGGLKRIGSGVAYPVGYQAHAATETCPGHSTVLTGDHPSHSGIVANAWFDRRSGSSLYCVAVPGTGDPLARGPQNLKVSTLGDWLKQAEPEARVISISGKDRAAIMLGGHHPDLVAWWVDGKGWGTSPYAGPETPAVAGTLQGHNGALFKAWGASPPALWSAAVPADCTPLEKPHHFGQIDISGHVPPEAAAAATAQPGFLVRTDFQDALRASPLFDKVALDLAADLAREKGLGKGRATDLLGVGLSATDYVGHRFGNGGAEMCANLHALDRNLGVFLAKIDGLGVPYMVVLTADHGAADAAERLQEQGVAALRIDTVAVAGALNRHLKEALGISSEPIVAEDPQQLYINTPGDAAFIARVRDETVRWLKQQPGIAAVLTRDEVAAAVPPRGKSPADLTVAERFNLSYDPERSGDIMVELAKEASLGIPRSAGDSIAGHGSPWDYDRQVPILFWWPGAAPRTSSDPVETIDIAPTLAAATRVQTQPVDGRCLSIVTACSQSALHGERGLR
jgi:predicted AlkP superfamily pyrophosphatase or phosphodiesterase